MQQNIDQPVQEVVSQGSKGLSEQPALKIGLPARLALIVVACLIAYIPAMRGGFIWDDDDYVQNNQMLRSADGLRQIWFKLGATPQYYPMVHTSYWLEYRFWKLNPTGYHVVNVLLHAAGAVLLWRVLRVLQVPGAWVAAAIFALHPVHVESVAWITERKNVLSGVFYLGAALLYLRYALAPRNESGHNRSGKFYVASLVLFLCALLSKTVTCTLPAVLLLLLWWKRKRIGWPEVRALVPFFALGIAMGLLTVWMEKYRVGAVGEEWDLSLVERCLVAGQALCFYVDKLFWPRQLTFIYPQWQIDAGACQLYLYPVISVGVIAASWLARKRIGNGPLVAVLYFSGTLFPALGFFDVFPMRYSFVADHFQYLASIGIIALVVAIGCLTSARLGRRGKVTATTVAVFVLGMLGTLTWRQGHIYKDRETLWRDTLRKNPDSWIAHNNLGAAIQSQSKLDEAIKHYHQALQPKPDYALAHGNLNSALQSQSKLEEVISHYRRALEIKPDYALAHSNLGVALQAQGKFDEAISHLHQALQAKPHSVNALYNLATIFRLQGMVDEAIIYYRQALQIEPDSADVYNSLGIAFDSLGKVDEAVRHYRRALELMPDYATAHNNLANVLQSQGKLDEAINHYRQAVQIEPDLVQAHYNLGVALRSQGKLNEAAGHFRQAVQIAPDFAQAHRRLGVVLQLQGKLEEAVSHYHQALDFKPDYAEAHSNLGIVLQMSSQLDESLEHFQEAMRLKPDSPVALNGIAWVLAVHPEPALRDAGRAVELAERAAELTRYQNAHILDTLAAAYASAGQFDRAVTTAQAALELASAAQNDELANSIHKRLELYKQAKPYQEPVREQEAINPY